MTRAAELVQAGAIGRVVQTVGFGPHRLNRHLRPDWFFDPAQAGGILTDIGSHQIDQFLHFTGSDDAEIVASAVANYANPDQPEFEDFGEILLRSERGNGYIRVDWYTPDGLPTWGDGRCTILGTEGYIELRKYVDIAGRDGTDHLFLVDRQGTRTSTAAMRLALLRAPDRRRVRAHRDRDGAGALLQGVRARARGPGARRAPGLTATSRLDRRPGGAALLAWRSCPCAVKSSPSARSCCSARSSTPTRPGSAPSWRRPASIAFPDQGQRQSRAHRRLHPPGARAQRRGDPVRRPRSDPGRHRARRSPRSWACRWCAARARRADPRPVRGARARDGREQLRQADVPRAPRRSPRCPAPPGLICPVGDKVIYAVPGVPHEMQTMMRGTVLPDLQRRAGLAR